MSFANRLSFSSLNLRAKAIALWEFEKIKSMEQMYSLEFEDIFQYLDESALNVNGNEYFVFDVIKKWVEINGVTDCDTIFLLLSTLRLQNLSEAELINIVSCDFIKGNHFLTLLLSHFPEIRKKVPHLETEEKYPNSKTNLNILVNAKYPHLFNNFDDVLLKNRALPLVPCVNGFPSLLPSDCLNNETKTGLLRAYLWSQGRLIPLVTKLEVPICIAGYRIICVGVNFYIIGGQFITRKCRDDSWSTTLWVYDTLTEKWQQESVLPNQRRHHSALFLNNEIYLIGGVGKHRIMLKTITKYNILTKEWFECKSLPRSVTTVACCEFEGDIYIIDTEIMIYKTTSNDLLIKPTIILPNGISFKCALAYKSWIYLIGAPDPKIYRFQPKEINPKVEQVGRFTTEGNNACIVFDKMFHFGENDTCVMIEEFNLNLLECEIVFCIFKDSDRDTLFDINGSCFPCPYYC